MATFEEYTKMSREQLLKDLAESKKALFDIRYQVQNKQSKSSHMIASLKTSIAQILTVLNGGTTGAKDLETEDKTVQNAPAQKVKATKKSTK